MLETENWKVQTLPLARIKKIMKSEEFALQVLERQKRLESGEEVEVIVKPGAKFMISAEAPLLMTKACELLIQELCLRAWKHTDTSRRKTLQRGDVHAAVGESDAFDFLIDIVPRVTVAPSTTTTTTAQTRNIVNLNSIETNSTAIPTGITTLFGNFSAPAQPAVTENNENQNNTAVDSPMLSTNELGNFNYETMAFPQIQNQADDVSNAQNSIPQIQQQWASENSVLEP